VSLANRSLAASAHRLQKGINTKQREPCHHNCSNFGTKVVKDFIFIKKKKKKKNNDVQRKPCHQNCDLWQGGCEKKSNYNRKKKKKKTLYYIASRARQDSATFGCKGSTCTGIKVEHI
jgi:hypothetical protein